MSKFDKAAWFKSLERQARLAAVEWVASLEGLGSAQKSVLFALASTVNANYESEVSMRDISASAGISMRAAQHALYGNVTIKKNGKEFVRKSIDELVPGALKIRHRKCGVRQNLSNIYTLGVPRPIEPAGAVTFPPKGSLDESDAPADSSAPPTAESALEENESQNLRSADSAAPPEESAGRSQSSSSSKRASSLCTGTTDKPAGKEDDDAQYPEPYFLEKVVYAWNTCLVPLGAAPQLSVDPQIRRMFKETYRLNNSDLPANREGTLPSIDNWIWLFRYIAESNFLMGRVKLRNGETFQINFKYLLGSNEGGYPRTYQLRDKKFHRTTSLIHPRDWNIPDFSKFDPKMYWGAR